jgi:hypothetical protein
MKKQERIRDLLSAPPGAGYLKQRAEEGWRPVAMEWEREVDETASAPLREPVPFGLRVSSDCLYLEENPRELEALRLMLAFIVDDQPLSKVASELNQRGFRTRAGSGWTQVQVFEMLPRLIEVAPRIMSDREWAEVKPRLLRVR